MPGYNLGALRIPTDYLQFVNRRILVVALDVAAYDEGLIF